MFGMGLPEIILIIAIALVVIGPKKIPSMAKALGRAMGEFKKATSEIKESMHIDELNESLDEFSGDLKNVLKDDEIDEDIKKEPYSEKKEQENENTKKNSEKIIEPEEKKDE